MTGPWIPRQPSELRGLRFARWFRESTEGQADRYGLRSQRQMQDRSVEEFGLVDTGLEWTVLKSAWSGRDSAKNPPVARSEGFRAMVHAAGEGRFDVLLVGYASRFLRDLTLALNCRRDFMNIGVVIWICDDKVLSSDEREWGKFVQLLTDAEAFSRTQSRNVSAGYTAKRKEVRDPGGHAPLGFRRVPFLDGVEVTAVEAAAMSRRLSKVLARDADGMALVRRIFELGAAGRTDWEIVEATGQRLHTVRSVLKNPLYIGQLVDGTEFRLGPSIDIATWNQVQARRAERRTREPGKVVMRSYALKVKCEGCEGMLHGDMERYRHPLPVCDAFSSAKPTVPPVRGRHNSSEGKSYRQDWIEAIPGRLLSEIASTPAPLVDAVLGELLAAPPVTANEVALARIQRQVKDASDKYAIERDMAAFQLVLDRLDAERRMVESASATRPELDPAEAAAFVRSLSELWARSAPRERQELAIALFESWSFLGFRRATYTWSSHAIRHGLDRLIPPVLAFDLAELDLPGGPTGSFTLSLSGREAGKARALRAS